MQQTVPPGEVLVDAGNRITRVSWALFWELLANSYQSQINIVMTAFKIKQVCTMPQAPSLDAAHHHKRIPPVFV
jgi:hypothetical protein